MVHHTGSVDHPGVYVVQKGTNDHISECPIGGEDYAQVPVKTADVMSVIVDSHIEPLESAKLHFNHGVEIAKQIIIIKIVAGLPQTKVDTIL